MAKAESEPNFGEKGGAIIRNLGIVGGIIGIIGMLAKSEMLANLVLPSAGVIVTGEALRQLSKSQKKAA